MAIGSLRSLDISDEEVTRILDRLDAADAHPPFDRREHGRQPLRGKAIVVKAQTKGPLSVGYRAYLRNVSDGGLAFIAAMSISPGTLLELELPPGPAWQTTKAIVRHCRYVETGVQEIGAEFVRQDTQ